MHITHLLKETYSQVSGTEHSLLSVCLITMPSPSASTLSILSLPPLMSGNSSLVLPCPRRRASRVATDHSQPALCSVFLTQDNSKSSGKTLQTPLWKNNSSQTLGKLQGVGGAVRLEVALWGGGKQENTSTKRDLSVYCM